MGREETKKIDCEKLDECDECGGYLEDLTPYFRGKAWIECMVCGNIIT